MIAVDDRALDELESAAYFEARLEFLERPDVRLFTRRDAELGHVAHVLAEVTGTLRGPGTVTFRAGYTVSLGNAGEPEVLRHQARALRRELDGELLTGSERNALNRDGRPAR